MLQFEYLNKEKISSQLELVERIELFLSKIDRSYQLAVEIRNKVSQYLFRQGHLAIC